MRAIVMRSAAVLMLLILLAPLEAQDNKPRERWSREQAAAWYAKQPWLVGCNFIPSSAINQLEMWQADTFDPATIDRELGWAATRLGFNSVRVFLHDLAYDADPQGFKQRLEKFLQIADARGIRPLVVLFDDCWNPEPKVGKQPAARPGVHNSGWMRSPGPKVVNDPAAWVRLERYVTDVLTTFGKDRRVLMWDLYNEPGNEKQGNRSIPLLEKTFAWARQVGPEQPLTAGLWRYDMEFQKLNDAQLALSDVVTFHHYGKADDLRKLIGRLRKDAGRALICTEWMARTNHSLVADNLPVFYEEQVGCYNWGLVAGKTQTIFPWGSKEGSPEPKIWFHDLFRGDGTPFDAREVELFQKYTKAAREQGGRPGAPARSTGLGPPWPPRPMTARTSQGEPATPGPRFGM